MSIFDLFVPFRVLWERLAPILGLLFFIIRVMVFLGSKKMDAQPSSKWKTRSRRGSYSPPRWSAPSRTRYSKRWSVNDIPRP